MSLGIRSVKKEYYSLLHRGVCRSIDPPSTEAAQDDAADDPEAVFCAIADMAQKESRPPCVDARLALIRYAPTALVSGCWLWSSVAVHRTHTRLGEALLSSLFLLLGEGDTARHQANLYRGMLASASVSLPPLGGDAFAQDARLCEEDFALALCGLRAGRRIPYDLAEVLGVHAAMTLWGPPPVVVDAASAVCGDALATSSGVFAVRQSQAVALLRTALQEYATTESPSWNGVLTSARRVLEKRLLFASSFAHRPVLTSWQQMHALVEQKFRHGFGFHKQVRLAGRSLDSWFDPQHPDLPGFLLALSKSPWIAPGRPQQSLLLTRTTQFGGTMFGVFAAQELETIARWIAELPESAQPSGEPIPSAEIHSDTASFQKQKRNSQPDLATTAWRGEVDPRVLYHKLLTAADEDEWITASREYVCDRLAEVDEAGDAATLARQGLWPNSASALRAWVDAQLRQQVLGDADSVTPSAQPESMGIERGLSKTQVLWLLSQLAPAAFIDGAWLQDVVSPLCSTTPAAGILLQIYRDELGAGVIHQHHGNIMRRVLSEQGVELPACDSLDFVKHPGFLKESFLTPVLWLAMSLHAQEFFPELLGLNLAIELAGVGRGYDRASALLRKHGIDPYFFVLHNTIDNGASGHTAWSVWAIQQYLDNLASTADDSITAVLWQRVFRGYATYGRSSAPLLRAVALRIGPKLGLRLLRQLVSGTTAAEKR